jgi:hypothetical protein
VTELMEVTIAIRSRGMKQANLDAFVAEMRAQGLQVEVYGGAVVTPSGALRYNRRGPRLVAEKASGTIGVACQFLAGQHWTLQPWAVKQSAGMGMDNFPAHFSGEDGPKTPVRHTDWIVWLANEEYSAVVSNEMFEAGYTILQ